MEDNVDIMYIIHPEQSKILCKYWDIDYNTATDVQIRSLLDLTINELKEELEEE